MTEAPDKMTLTAFSARAKGEIDRTQFAATTGGLVTLSAQTYWELLYAAQAWHGHAQEVRLQAELDRINKEARNDLSVAKLNIELAVAKVTEELQQAGAPAEAIEQVAQAGKQ